MLTQVIASAAFAGILGAYGVEKLFFCVIGAFPYLYLFFTVGGSFDIQVRLRLRSPCGVLDHACGAEHGCSSSPLAESGPGSCAGGSRPRKAARSLRGNRANTCSSSRSPSFLAWCAGLIVIAIFLHRLPDPGHVRHVDARHGRELRSRMSSRSRRAERSVNQAFNVASLNGVTTATNAAAYSTAQQLITTAWNIVFGIIPS